MWKKLFAGTKELSLLVNSSTYLDSGQLLDDGLELLPLDKPEPTLGCHCCCFHVCLVQLLFHNLQEGKDKGVRQMYGCTLIKDDYNCWEIISAIHRNGEQREPASGW